MAEDKKKVFVCNICKHKPEFTANSSLQRHNKSFHEKTKQEFKCPLCNSTYGRKDHLDRHIRTLHKREPREVAQETKEETKQETKEETKQETKQETKVKHKQPSKLRQPRVLPNWVKQADIIAEVDKIKSTTKEPKKVAKPKNNAEFLEKERIRQQKIRDKKYEEEGRIQMHYDTKKIEGESPEDRKRRLKNARQARWRAKVKLNERTPSEALNSTSGLRPKENNQ